MMVITDHLLLYLSISLPVDTLPYVLCTSDTTVCNADKEQCLYRTLYRELFPMCNAHEYALFHVEHVNTHHLYHI